jgi:hypothetical protein
MPLKNGRFTAFERKFIEPMARTGDVEYAGTKAGLAHPLEAGAKMLRRPAIKQAVIERAQSILRDELLPTALEALRDLLDPKTPHGARLGAVKLVVDQTLGADEASKGLKEPSEMSYDELQESIEQLRRAQDAIAGQAIDVTPEQDSEPVLTGGLFD